MQVDLQLIQQQQPDTVIDTENRFAGQQEPSTVSSQSLILTKGVCF